jgi:arabinan endo-1,5-alpha-L-arabinosidase
MSSFWRTAGVCLLALVLSLFCSSCGVTLFGHLSYASEAADPLAHYMLTGDTLPVLDPSVIRQGSTYYAFSTDVAGFSASGNLPIHCSQEKVNWTTCGSVFPAGIPAWVKEKVPGVAGLWAPDVSYFNGEYHLYYNGSLLHTQQTVIGLVTNSTLDSADPSYKWVDRGVVLASNPGDDFNALDPTILVDSDGSVWLTYGSYWTGIKQRQVDPATGMLLASNSTRYDLATRPGVPHNPIEGPSLVRHRGYYYLFVSVDFCCESDVATNNYKQAVGRSTSPHGPFVDEVGTPMMNGGGTVLIQGDNDWGAPGGGTAYLDAVNDDSLIIFHAHNLAKSGHPYQWIKKLDWVNDWPVVGDE